MAALDFPNPPLTVGQQYSGTNGVVYQWDGAVWVLTGSFAGQPAGGDLQGTYPNPTVIPAAHSKWTDSGTTLTPNTPTERVVIPGPTASGADQSQLVLGTRTIKSRLAELPSLDLLYCLSNSYYTGTAWAQDDNTKVSWQTAMGAQIDGLQILRSPAAGAFTTLLTLDSGGNLRPAGQLQLGWGSVLTQGSVFTWNPGNGPAIDLCGNPGQADTGRPVWTARCDTTNDLFQVIRQAPSGGATQDAFHIDNAWNLVLAGTVGQKASGTTWSNPSDIRLKTDLAPYTRSLADVCKLDPITYSLKTAPGTHYGFDAAKVRAVFPECISETRMKLSPDDAEETDGVLVLDMHPILVALVNAVKELAAKGE